MQVTSTVRAFYISQSFELVKRHVGADVATIIAAFQTIEYGGFAIVPGDGHTVHFRLTHDHRDHHIQVQQAQALAAQSSQS